MITINYSSSSVNSYAQLRSGCACDTDQSQHKQALANQPSKATPQNIIEAFAEQKHPWRVEPLPRMNPASAQPPDPQSPTQINHSIAEPSQIKLTSIGMQSSVDKYARYLKVKL